MKNLKKSLALVLAVVMVFSLCVIANAEYTDQDVIGAKYETAVGVMSGIGVIAGDDTGKLAPQGNFTREQACKIIAYMKLGTAAASKLSTSVAPFDDVAATKWSAPFIAYCVNAGIVNGYGDGNFGPNDVLTGYQWAKMLLCALGYGVNGEYTGDAWQIAVAKDALPLGVYKGDTDGATSEPITREQAILFAFNTLTNIPEVDYSAYIGKYVVKGTSYGGTSTTTTYLSDNFNLRTIWDAVILANAETDSTLLTKKGPKTAFDFEYFDDDDDEVYFDGEWDAQLYYASTAEDVGHMGDVYFDYVSKKVYFFDDFTKVVTFTNRDTAATFAAGLFDLDVANKSRIIFTLQDNVLTTNGAQIIFGTSAPGVAPGTLGGYTFYVANGIVIAVVKSNSVTVDKVTKVTNTAANESITLAKLGVLHNSRYNDEVKEYEGIAKNDLVIVTANSGAGTGTVYTLTKATAVDGKVSGKYVATAGGFAASTITLADGTKLRCSSATLNADKTGLSVDLAALNYTSTYTFYLDNTGAVIGWTVKVSAIDPTYLVFVTGTYTKEAGKDQYGNDTEETYYVQGVTIEGKEVNLRTDDEFGGAVKGEIFTYTAAYDATAKAVLNTFSQPDGTYETVNEGSAAIAANAYSVGGFYYTDDVVVIKVTGYGDTIAPVKGTVSTGKQGFQSGDFAVYASKTGNNFIARYLFVTGTASATASTSYIFANEAADSVSFQAYTTAQGTTAWAYAHNVYVDGVPTTIYTTSATKLAGFKAFTVDKSGSMPIHVIGDNASGWLDQEVTANYNGIITTDDDHTFNANGVAIINALTGADLQYSSLVPTDAAELGTEWTISVKYNTVNGVDVVAAMYVVDYTPAD